MTNIMRHRTPGFYWAWNSDGSAQIVQAVGAGTVRIIGSQFPISESCFASIAAQPIELPMRKPSSDPGLEKDIVAIKAALNLLISWLSQRQAPPTGGAVLEVSDAGHLHAVLNGADPNINSRG